MSRGWLFCMICLLLSSAGAFEHISEVVGNNSTSRYLVSFDLPCAENIYKYWHPASNMTGVSAGYNSFDVGVYIHSHMAPPDEPLREWLIDYISFSSTSARMTILSNRTVDGHDAVMASLLRSLVVNEKPFKAVAAYYLDERTRILIDIETRDKDSVLPDDWIELPLSTMHVERLSG